jgi:rhodanese-related sulfurtransferase
VALKLKRLGIRSVRPLAGGIEAWQERRLPVVARAASG